MRTRLKICCIGSIDEARLAIMAGADAVGLVGAMPSGDGMISDERIAAIARIVPPPVASILLTSERRAETIADHVRRTRPAAVQIVHEIEPGESARLAMLIPHVRRIQVVHVEGPDALERRTAYMPHVDAFLLDSGRPGAAIPELGGTGRVHDWDVSAAFVKASTLPVFLAGGLDAGNAGAAIAHVRPFGLDLCSGLRSEGHLDPVKLDAFVKAVAEADRRTS